MNIQITETKKNFYTCNITLHMFSIKFKLNFCFSMKTKHKSKPKIKNKSSYLKITGIGNNSFIKCVYIHYSFILKNCFISVPENTIQSFSLCPKLKAYFRTLLHTYKHLQHSYKSIRLVWTQQCSKLSVSCCV